MFLFGKPKNDDVTTDVNRDEGLTDPISEEQGYQNHIADLGRMLRNSFPEDLSEEEAIEIVERHWLKFGI